jgi:hypothetical protein
LTKPVEAEVARSLATTADLKTDDVAGVARYGHLPERQILIDV